MSGRFVIVQMDNGDDALNLKEVKAFGRSGSLLSNQPDNYVRYKKGEKNCAPSHLTNNKDALEVQGLNPFG